MSSKEPAAAEPAAAAPVKFEPVFVPAGHSRAKPEQHVVLRCKSCGYEQSSSNPSQAVKRHPDCRKRKGAPVEADVVTGSQGSGVGSADSHLAQCSEDQDS